MSSGIQIIVCSEGAIIYHPQAKGEQFILREEEVVLGKRVADYCLREGVKELNINLLVAEELLFYKDIYLPSNTSDIKEAIGYQVGMATPYSEEEIFYSYVQSREKDLIKVTLVATPRDPLADYIKQLTSAGFRIDGLYPEIQRYIHKSLRRSKWALVMPGFHAKILVFSGNQLEERILCSDLLEFDELAVLSGTENIYSPFPLGNDRFLDANTLLDAKQQFKDLNMLPASMRRPDFSKVIIKVLVGLNVLALVFMVAGKEYRLRSMENQVEAEISQLLPTVREVRTLQAREKEIQTYIEDLESIGQNPNIIGFLDSLTKALPNSAYLDQIMMDKKQQSIHIQGYANDIGEVTAKLQQVGDAKLKSTSRRREQNYFNVEIGLP